VPKLLGARVILDQHDPMPELLMTMTNAGKSAVPVRVIRRLERWSIACVDRVITVNAAMKRLVGSRSCHPDKIDIVMNCPNDTIFPLHAVARRRPRGSYDPFVLMYHGTLVERNGLQVAVNAVERVRWKIPWIELRIYGKRTAYLDTSLRYVSANGLEEWVRYCGPRALEELAAEINNCDVGVIPNICSPFTQINTPTRLFEYLALGKPVIAPFTPGVLDYFKPGTLLFFAPGSAESLAAQIESACVDYDHALLTAVRGQRVYLDHTWPQEREKLVRSVDALFQRDPSSHAA
jgi:glycosyltransferase involved in cell wall biosynthesis